jgi:transcriptional/translational regulatory protein YebC/TACO1
LLPSQRQSQRNIADELERQNQDIQAARKNVILDPQNIRAAAAELQKYNAQIQALTAKKTATQQFRPNDKEAVKAIEAEIDALEKRRNAYSVQKLGFDNIGFGKFRFLRIDYVRAYQNGYQGDGVMFGLKF